MAALLSCMNGLLREPLMIRPRNSFYQKKNEAAFGWEYFLIAVSKNRNQTFLLDMWYAYILFYFSHFFLIFCRLIGWIEENQWAEIIKECVRNKMGYVDNTSLLLNYLLTVNWFLYNFLQLSRIGIKTNLIT